MNTQQRRKLTAAAVAVMVLIIGGVVVMRFTGDKSKAGYIPGKVKTMPLMLQVKGTINMEDGLLVLTTSNKGYKHVLTGVKAGELKNSLGRTIVVFGKILNASPSEINKSPVKCNIEVTKYGTKSSLGEPVTDSQLALLAKKIEKKRQLQEEVLTKLQKKRIYEVISGQVRRENREILPGEKLDYYIIETEDKDKYALIGFHSILKKNTGKNLVILGEEGLPVSNYPVLVDEVNFHVSEVYDDKLKQLK